MIKFISTFVLFITFYSSASHAEWEFLGKSKNGSNLYFDNVNFKKNLGHLYFFGLYDFIKPNNYGTLSVIAYYKLSCNTLKYKSINDKMYKKPMGEGSPRIINKPDRTWRKTDMKYFKNFFEEVCSYQD